jgi:hypothetical protein
VSSQPVECTVARCRIQPLPAATPLEIGGERVGVDLRQFHADDLVRTLAWLNEAAGEAEEYSLPLPARGGTQG